MRIHAAAIGFCIALPGFGGGGICAWAADWSWLSPELRRMEAERSVLQNTLAELPTAPAAEITQRLGWHSEYSSTADRAEWVELRLEQTEPLDAVVLVAPPTSASGTPGYGFPVRFQVELLGEGDDATRTLIADHTREDFPNPGLLPVLIPTKGHAAARVRITATRLFRDDQRFLCALGEVMLLRGNRNLAAKLEAQGPQQVRASSSQGTRPDWGRINVVDGHIATGPPLGTRAGSTLGYHSQRMSESRDPPAPWVSIDLGAVLPIDEVRLFPAHPPQFAHTQGYGFPVRYQIELRASEDAPPIVLPTPQSGGYHALPGDNVQTLVANQSRGRHVRLSVLAPHVSNGSAVLALAEMQVWSGGKNVALGKPVSDLASLEEKGWSRAALVDGFSSTNDILDWPGWLAGLSQRREIQQQIATLDWRQQRLTQQWQRRSLAALALVTLAALVGSVVWFMRERRTQQREMEALRQRIARDLHDEIGSSLGSISLITQDILAHSGDAAQTNADLREIKHIADETVSAMRDITRLIQSDRYGSGDLASLLRETATRLLRTISHEVKVETTPPTHPLPVDAQRDLILMFKEALYNITRHAAASRVDIHLIQNSAQLTLRIHDNGCGFHPTAPTPGMGLANLQRRAAKHRGHVEITSTPGQGTTLHFLLPTHG